MISPENVIQYIRNPDYYKGIMIMNTQIMVVEDEGIVAHDIQQTLKSLGYGISAIASTGEDALKKIYSSSPDLILMDIKLKGKLDGIKISQEIKNKLDIPVVYLTAYVDENTLARAKKTMPYGYVIKPFEKNDLRTVIELALYRHRKERETHTWGKISSRIFHSAPMCMAVVDMNFRIKKANASLCETVSSSNEDLTKLSFFSMIQSKSIKHIKEQVKKLSIHDTDSFSFESLFGTGKDNSFPALISISLIGDDRGNPLHHLAMIENITERKMIEEQLEKDKMKAEEYTEHTLSFLANISHELKTPLSTIIGYSNLMLNCDLNGERQDYLENIRESGNLLLSIINNILDQSKIDAGQIEIEHIPFSLKSILETTEASAKILLAQKGKEVAVRRTFSDKVSNVIAGDPTRLQQVLNNLMSNAVKFTDQGFIEFGVSQVNKDWLEIYVRDTGIGIAPDRKKSIFDPYVQADSSTTRKYGGTGLGLSITKKLIELMGGEINVKSRTGQDHGSVFYFTLPYEPVEDFDFGENSNSTNKNSLSKGTILVVDDNITNRKIATKIVEKLGYTVQWAKDGSEAVSLFKSPDSKFDIILLDIKMPVLDGLHVAQIIREIEKNEKRDRIPIIALSAASLKKEKDLCIEAGCDYFMKKPVSHDHIKRILKSFLDNKSTMN